MSAVSTPLARSPCCKALQRAELAAAISGREYIGRLAVRIFLSFEFVLAGEAHNGNPHAKAQQSVRSATKNISRSIGAAKLFAFIPR
jgi:hypothetical protein